MLLYDVYSSATTPQGTWGQTLTSQCLNVLPGLSKIISHCQGSVIKKNIEIVGRAVSFKILNKAVTQSCCIVSFEDFMKLSELCCSLRILDASFSFPTFGTKTSAASEQTCDNGVHESFLK
jgi:hypothetical protein